MTCNYSFFLNTENSPSSSRLTMITGKTAPTITRVTSLVIGGNLLSSPMMNLAIVAPITKYMSATK